MDKEKLTNVFTYGTLMYEQVIRNIVKHTYSKQKALLKHYHRRHVKNAVYPGVTRSQGKQVAGIVYYNVNQQDLQALDYFESQEYEKDAVKVLTQSGQTVEAIVYRYVNEKNLQGEEWRKEEFQNKHKLNFVSDHLEVKAHELNPN